MQLPFFYEENLPTENEFILSEETSRHIVQVLRMKAGDQLHLTDGKGCTKTASLLYTDKKVTRVKVNDTMYNSSSSGVTIGISLIKNSSRFEWFLEKATEIGVSGIVPFISNRTEKQSIKLLRMRNILVSAMLQSRQSCLPEILEPVAFKDVIANFFYENKYIAHCANGQKNNLDEEILKKEKSILLIGPEGDFTEEEISMATAKGFLPVSLGETRLRTETAAIVAAVLLLHKKI